MIENRNVEKEVLMCEECKTRFEEKTQYENHVKTSHAASSEKCDNCNLNFPNGDSLRAHVLSTHSTVDTVDTEAGAVGNSSDKIGNEVYISSDNRTRDNNILMNEKKEYTMSELNLLLMKKSKIKRSEGPASIRTKNRKGI